MFTLKLSGFQHTNHEGSQSPILSDSFGSYMTSHLAPEVFEFYFLFYLLFILFIIDIILFILFILFIVYY
jgi:hypothetical protein